MQLRVPTIRSSREDRKSVHGPLRREKYPSVVAAQPRTQHPKEELLQTVEESVQSHDPTAGAGRN